VEREDEEQPLMLDLRHQWVWSANGLKCSASVYNCGHPALSHTAWSFY